MSTVLKDHRKQKEGKLIKDKSKRKESEGAAFCEQPAVVIARPLPSLIVNLLTKATGGLRRLLKLLNMKACACIVLLSKIHPCVKKLDFFC